ncbi:MAG: LVIVD repeat-containing protein [Anaerolineae bacterium]
MVEKLSPALGPQAQPPASPAVARARACAWWTIPGLRPFAGLLALALGLGPAVPGAAWQEAEAVAGPGLVAAGSTSAPAGRPAERRAQVAQAVQAAQAAAAPLAPRRLGQVGGYSGALAVRGSLAVFAMGRRMRSADLSDPAQPTLLGEGPELADLVHDIALSGDLAVVAAGNAGLWLLDLADPRRPRAVGSLATPGVARGVAVDGDLAYLAAGDAGLLVVDIARPAQPRLLAIADTPGDAGDVVVTGRHAFVADWTEGLKVFDVADARAPRQVAALGLETLAEGLLLQGDKLYVSTLSSTGIAGVLLVDISIPAAPRRVGSVAEDRAALTRGPFLFTLDAYGQVSVLVVTDPYQSKLVRRRKAIPGFEGQVVALDEIGGQALLVAVGVGPDGTGSIATIAIDDPVFMERKGQTTFNDSPRLQAAGIALFGEHACVLDARAGRVRILELSPVHAPRQVGELARRLSEAARVVVDGRYAYLFDSSLVIVDLRDLTAPTFAHNEPLDLRISVEDLVVQDGYAYLAPRGERGLKVLDVSDPRSVSEVAEVVGIGGVSSVAVRQPRAYLASSTGLQVVDVSDPRAPRRLGQVPLAGLEWVELGNRQDLVYATRRVSDQHVLLAIDTSTASAPRVVETMDLPEEVGGLKVSGDLAYVINSIDSAKKLWSIDLTLPLASRTAQLVRTAWPPYDLATQGELLMIGNPYAGVEIFTTLPPARPELPERVWLPYVNGR